MNSKTVGDMLVFRKKLYVYLQHILGTARRIRGDHGTENLNVAGIQRFFHRNGTDDFAGEKSLQFGKPTANQVWCLSFLFFASFVV